MLLQMDRLPLWCLINLQEQLFLSPGLCFDFLPVIGSAVFRLSGNGIEPAPGLPPDKVQLSFFFFGELFIRNKFFHIFLLMFHI